MRPVRSTPPDAEEKVPRHRVVSLIKDPYQFIPELDIAGEPSAE
jgi:hypothetical protein